MREIILDLIADVRCSERWAAEGLNAETQLAYAAQCRADIRRFYAARHSARMDRYGWPILPSSETN